MTNATLLDSEIHDEVNHPKHYTDHPSGIECIQVTEHMNFNLGNATKYIWRADLKHDDGGIIDLEKAAWYVNREIERRKKLQTSMPMTTSGPGAINLTFKATTDPAAVATDILSHRGSHAG
jgi:hypothetical protein